MEDKKIDWENDIIQICQKCGIDVSNYNTEDEVKEFVAKSLGFKDFAAFQRFPNTQSIMHNVADDISSEDEYHMSHVFMLVNTLASDLITFYNLTKNESEFNRMLSHTLNWAQRNLKLEMKLVLAHHLSVIEKIADVENKIKLSAITNF